jgi:hypothetical protein
VGKLIREHNVDVLPGTPQMHAELSRWLPTARSSRSTRPYPPPARVSIRRWPTTLDKYGIRLLSCYH